MSVRFDEINTLQFKTLQRQLEEYKPRTREEREHHARHVELLRSVSALPTASEFDAMTDTQKEKTVADVMKFYRATEPPRR